MLLHKLFEYTNSLGIKCCSLKNNHQLEGTLVGDRDLDLYVHVKDHEEFAKILCEFGFKYFTLSGVDIEGIEHYYGYCSEQMKLMHIQWYKKIFTGNSLVKEYNFQDPEDWLFVNSFEYIKGLLIPEARVQKAIYLLREVIKSQTITGRILVKKEYVDYELEKVYVFPQDKFSDNSPDVIVVKNNFSCEGVIAYRRFNAAKILLLEVSAVFVRLVYKLLSFNKKRREAGLVIGITGSDGSGKSTLVHNLLYMFNGNFRATTIHIGRPTNISFGTKVESKSTSFRDFKSIVLALFRVLLAIKAQVYKYFGYLVIVDRCLGSVVGTPDSPRIEGHNMVSRFLSKVERKLYHLAPRFDVVYKLDVNVENALERNQQRIKVDKETDDEIRFRHNVSGKMKFLAVDVVIVNANESESNVLLFVSNDMWSRT